MLTLASGWRFLTGGCEHHLTNSPKARKSPGSERAEDRQGSTTREIEI
jgi:hypothetical protein